MNAYDLVEKWVKEEKRTFFADNMFNKEDERIALTILQHCYNARYEPSDDPHYCGTWYIDNPYCPKIKGYKLKSCFRGKDNWEILYSINPQRCPQWQKNVAQEILRLEDNCKDSQEEIERFITKNFYYVGNERFWEIVETKIYI